MIILSCILILQIVTVVILTLNFKRKHTTTSHKQSAPIGPFLTKKPRRVPLAKSDSELYQMELDKIKK